MEFSRLRFIYAELDDGNIRFREHMTEHRPRTMIEAPVLFIQSNRERSKYLLDHAHANSGSPGAG